MKIRIITSCTGEKKHSPENQLNQSDFEHLFELEIFQARECELDYFRTSAAELYTGQQHVRLMRGVNALSRQYGAESIDLWILSAGYGIIPGNRAIVPYECTFQGMKSSEIHQWASHLRVPEEARRFFSQQSDLTLVLLGDSYLQALQLDDQVVFNAPTLFLTSTGSQKLVRGQGQWRAFPLTNADASRFSCGLVGLKGELAHRLLNWLAKHNFEGINTLFDPETDLRAMLDIPVVPTASNPKPKSPQKAAKPSAPEKPKKSPARVNPKVDQVIQIPDSWWQKPHRDKLRYFIPEWDDLVDPDYDFEKDEHSGGTGDWSNEVYAHQLYSEPNYDGILISKVVAEKSAKKKQRINEMGVHRYLRVPSRFPIMGDCGAFGYIAEDVPPYTTPEILNYYTRLGFDYGVSIDHLIVSATEEQKNFRYELTIHNAEEFLREHRKLGLSWEPIGAVQGWDPQSYAKAARQYVAMGYRYIALGGLVRTTTKEILRVLQVVHKVVPETVKVHLFGLARIGAISEFERLGVQSIDSASYLRQAWMRGAQGYLLEEGPYATIRIPEAGKSFRSKRMVQNMGLEESKVLHMEQEAFQALRSLAKHQCSVDACLNAVLEYDRFISEDRVDMSALYLRTLSERPWERCSCNLCRESGVEIVVFRGNNRNRRRGFHNTYVFYNVVQRILNGETLSGWASQKTNDIQLSLFNGEIN